MAEQKAMKTEAVLGAKQPAPGDETARESGLEAEKRPQLVAAAGERSREAAPAGSGAVHQRSEPGVELHPADGEAILLPFQPSSNNAQKVVALTAVLFLCYFGKLVMVPLLCSLLLAFVLEPIVEGLQRLRIPRSGGALISMLLVAAVLYGISYFSYVKATEFVQHLPQYSEQIKGTVLKFRQQTQQFEKARQAVAPDQDKNAVKVKSANPLWEGLSSGATSFTEMLLAFSFVPFIAYFMLTWRDHARASAVKMFKAEDRTTAYVAIGRIAQMLRGFIVGNFVIGLVMGAANTVVFWIVGVPYPYFVGFISGFVSLVPYLGVPLAAVPPVAAGLGTLSVSRILIILMTVLVVHLVALNVLYPKFLGARMQLNPLVVTIALLVWGFIWGALGLILAVPITAAIKIVCDHVDSLRGLGELLGEGRSQ